jgi:hypothetical protein
MARIKRDRKFTRALYAEAASALMDGETAEGLSVLRDLVHAQITFKELARQTGLGEKTYNRAIMLRRFAATFPNTGVCDLSKERCFRSPSGEQNNRPRPMPRRRWLDKARGARGGQRRSSLPLVPRDFLSARGGPGGTHDFEHAMQPGQFQNPQRRQSRIEHANHAAAAGNRIS